MQHFLVEETPGKVMGFLGAALFSMALLFAVSGSNASFKAHDALPDPFSPAKVVSVIDSFAATYSEMVMNFGQPAREAFVAHVDQMKWVMEESSVPLVRTLGLEGLTAPKEQQASQVAGAFTVGGSQTETISVDKILAVLLSNW